MNRNDLPWQAVLVGAALLGAGSIGQAQIKKIPAGGEADLPADVVNFEPEYRTRMKKNLGQFSPAEPGTPPGSTDPRVIDGIWIAGTASALGHDAGNGPGGPGGPGGGPGGPPGAGAPPGAAGPGGGGGPPGSGGARQGANGLRKAPSGICLPGSAFTLGTPSKIIQTPKAIYILKVSSMSQNGTSYRRIDMTGTHAKNLTASYAGDAVGHWDGDTLVVETIGLKGPISQGGPGGPPGGGGGAQQQFTPQSVVTERIKKIEGNLKMEDLVSITDPALKQPIQTRLVSYWRPDLKFIEAPCEEYSDPLETENSGPFSGGDETQNFGAPPATTSTPPKTP